jgi:AcrR family transcriptional regulator
MNARSSPSRVHLAVRDPERTRDRILTAALKEFSLHGFAGARVDRIARMARVNKRMLYHYFGNKDDLFREILGRKLSQRAAWAAAAPEEPAASLEYWFEIVCREIDWLRLTQWEALEHRNGHIVRQAERRAALADSVERVARAQARGLMARDLDAEDALLCMAALTTYPMVFPQIVRLVTGLRPTDPVFQRRWKQALRRLAHALWSRHAARPRSAWAGNGQAR